ncbi:NUDIX domain-containing protein [Larkinella knui]|uniref:NUDIX hydrolase n=1 Tax=Larkinella knui TaxID=2025310 RepID=A0A3P1CV65_9BACT|nr:NUDIX domain-containing protein [Larkinella knui]RRB17149.1 NUDIX hydrolase [Larkinella knui]
MTISQTIKVAVDAVVFGYRNQALHLLLIQRKLQPYEGGWALPGGFVLDNESLEAAVQRELREETNVTINYLEQLYTFGAPERDPRFRAIAVAYYALVKPDAFEIAASTDADDVRWFDINALPELAFDHAEIIRHALRRLRNKLTYEPVGFGLLSEKFLFSDFEKLYSTLLNKPIDRRNFRKKVMSFGILTELDEKRSDGKGRPANLFQFNEDQYFKMKNQGFYFEL